MQMAETMIMVKLCFFAKPCRWAPQVPISIQTSRSHAPAWEPGKGAGDDVGWLERSGTHQNLEARKERFSSLTGISIAK